ncbi:hypothetical protein AGABI2DRAFT_147916 [Agaricus bisporus var. bisporus H97]|uniref:hypothetical protein n=1 Tax=Agaricus bisporus var. bisporus (strain H97 / ATCC MYA-4626 / FGSC 10389) TaxID=936046 RepID=UPI00029F5F5B|nr:hypothetical protein AGABI2DRAFT_147916 [Agaricus bisporus var. bisporus H97]EKV51583.1 hypothetical protein AGABI2DRAFT_147916 [Agaricus bisporus var. bisporus H97]
MARATRTAAHPDALSRKRKRNSSPPEKAQKVARSALAAPDSVLPDSLAHSILLVLENSDALGLLDRVFPLASTARHALSLRSLLASPQHHALCVLRAAINNLRPLSSHPRSRPSETASQQLHFCNLALSLLDQASGQIPSADLDTQSLLPPDSKSPPSPSLANRRYALVQHLPSGDYWSSLDSRQPSSSPTLPLKDLPTGHAELVAVLPTPSSSHDPKPPPTLGSYTPSTIHPKKSLPSQRHVPSSAFLDYGPWATFAPSIDHDCEIVGRRELGEVLWFRHERKLQRQAELCESLQNSGTITQVEPAEHFVDADVDADVEFADIFPPETIQNLKAALDNAELENLVDELLSRNQRALVRLQELQVTRLTNPDVAATTLDEHSEEREIAHNIVESLEILTSLRPRAASGQVISIVPPTSVLRQLHKTLALEPRSSWRGTLVPTRSTALRDDSTVKVRPSSTVPAAASSSSSPAPTSVTPSAPAAAPTTTPYAGYTYAYQAQQAQAYRPAAAATNAATYSAYKSNSTSYYQNYMQGAQQQQQQQQQQYYGQQAYGAGATGQQPYAAYSNWFAHAQYSQAAAAATGTASTGQGTPQPAAPTTAYGAYYQQPQQQKAPGNSTSATVATPPVANTVATNKAGTGIATGAWVGYAGQPPGGVAPTLPASMRTTTTAVPVANGYQPQQNYYGAYQTPQTSAK